MRALAKAKYGCMGFDAVAEGNTEIAVSYWENVEQIEAWKRDDEHLAAQKRGRQEWYESYQVQIVEVLRAYSST